MNSPETLQSNEIPAPKESMPLPADGTISQPVIERLFAARKQTLESMKPRISLKLYYRICEKLEQERTQLLKLLRLEDTKQEHLSKYSFILDSQFFEQKFLS